jgi:hypothetical protein
LVPGQLRALAVVSDYGGQLYIPSDIRCLSSICGVLGLAGIGVSNWTHYIGNLCQTTYILPVGYGHDRRGKLGMARPGREEICNTLPEQCCGEGRIMLV